MRKYIIFSSEIILKNKLLFTALVLQLVFMQFFALNTAYELYELNYPYYIAKGITQKNFIYFAPINYKGYNIVYGSDIASPENPYRDFDKLEGFVSEESVYSLESSAQKITLKVYPFALSEKLNVPVKKGKWLSQAEKTDGCINCVTSDSKRKIGEQIDFFDDENNLNFTLRVVGIVAEPYPDINLNVGGEFVRFGGVFSSIQKNEIGGIELLWTDDRSVVSTVKKSCGETENRMLFFENISAKQMRENIEVLKNSGNVLNLETAFDNDVKENMKEKDFPLMFCILAISVVGFCCAMLIFVKNASDYLTVYKVCGANRRQIKTICLTTSLSALLLAVLPYFILIPIACRLNLFYWIYSFMSIGVAVSAFCGFIFFLLSLSIVSVLFGLGRYTVTGEENRYD